MPRRLAAIDIGTNTVRLLVAEVSDLRHWHTLAQAQTVTRLGEGLSRHGRLSEVAMTRTTSAVMNYCREAEGFGANEILLVATSAVREADNRTTFVERLRKVTGRVVRVIFGDEEARLTFLGTRYGLDPPADTWVLIDIGGGSTEFIVADGETIRHVTSLQLGVVWLTETYLTKDPLDWTEYASLAARVNQMLSMEVPNFFSAQPISGIIGTAGTVTALAALDQQLETYLPERVQGYRLFRHRIERLLAFLGAIPLRERARLPCLEPGRADLIIAGISICLTTLALAKVENLLVSDYGLREGILLDYLGSG